MVKGRRSKVEGQRSKVNGQLSIVNYPLGTCDAFTKATGRLKELSIKKNSAYPVDKQGSVFLFSQINSIFSQKARCYFLISEIVFLASETTT